MSETLRLSSLLNFTDRQREMTRVADKHRYTLAGGARGGGKSRWLRWFLIRRLLQFANQGLRGVHVGLFCEDYPSLRSRQLSKIEVEFPSWLGKLVNSQVEGLSFILDPAYGSGVINLRNLDEPSKFRGSEWAVIAIDELTLDPLSAFNELRGSLRWPGVDRTQFIAGTNPNGRHSRWVREYWIERNFPPEMSALANEFAFVQSLADDNPYNSADYVSTLDSLPDTLRKAWRYGDWYVSNPQVVYADFGAENLTQDEPDPERPTIVSFDDGYVDSRAILFYQQYPDHVLVFDELYHSRHLPETCVSEVVAKCNEYHLPLPELAIGSPEATVLKEHFRRANIPARNARTDITQGIESVRQLIKDGQGVRSLRVHPRCKNLIRELTTDYQYPENSARSSSDKPLDKDNHASDSLRYYVFTRLANGIGG